MSCNSHLLNLTRIVRNLMYGFGDDRNPANDTVNVMEEILVEYIVDMVRAALFLLHVPGMYPSLFSPVSDCPCAGQEV